MDRTAPTLKTRLDNGLTVIIKEMRRAPVASFWVWYRVGGRNEVPGITGISHWVEHMVFKGTPTYQPGEIFRTVNKHGGNLNGFTWIDYTAYFETLPASQVLLGADIEADRMQNAVFDPDEVASERTVILSEREGNENQPTFFLREEVNAAAFKAHPYGQGVIGFTSDLHQITRDDLYSHYQTYYTPSNAAVVVAGDVDAESLLAQIAERFGAIPAGPEIPLVRTVEPRQEGQRRVTVRRPAPTDTLLMAYHAPRASDPDTPAMLVLDAVLSGGKALGFGGGSGMGRSSRLYRALVAAGLTSGAGSSMGLSIDPYLFSLSASLIPGVEPARVEAIVMTELARLREVDVPDGELARAVKQLRAQFAYGNESAGTQASWLGSLHTVDPALDPDDLIARMSAVTPDDVRRVANSYLTPDQATIGWLHPTVPSGGGTAAAEPAAARPHFFSDGQPAPDSPEAPRLGLRERHLDNGLHLIGHHDPSSEAVVIDMRLRAGANLDGDVPGLARFTGQMLTRGTARRDFAELNEELDGLAASIGVSVARDYVDVSGMCLKEDAVRLVELMAEVVLTPTFPDEEIDKVRNQSLTALRQMLDSTRAQASYLLRSSIYPQDHPYHHRTIGSVDSLTGMRREHLVDFHRRAYRPAGTIVATAGGLPVEDAWRLIEGAFGTWAGHGDVPDAPLPDVELPQGRVRQRGEIPGKSQSDIALGLPAIARDNPDYHALRTANLILGRLGLMGRLGASVRERQGLAYYASSSLETGLGRGLWLAYAGVSPANVERAIDSILAEVERLRAEPVEAAELADAKSYQIGSLPLGLETSGAVADVALDIGFYDLGLDYVERLPERIAALTRDDLQDVARRYLLPDHLVIAVVGPPDSA